MSRRKRHQERGAEAGQIEWLKHRTGFPTAEEREKFIQLRDQLSSEIIALAVSGAGRNDSRLQSLINRYGKEEVARAEKAFREGIDMPSRVADDARSFREYRLRYSRFGAGLPFLTVQQLDELYDKHVQRYLAETGRADPPAEAVDVEKLLLMNWRNWEDITPPAIPARPEDHRAPQPGSYSGSIAELLEWGNDLDRHHDFANEQEYLQWKRFIPALTRMALDRGLVGGWPSASASWAPWHAIHALGILKPGNRLLHWRSLPILKMTGYLTTCRISGQIWASKPNPCSG